MHSDHKFIDPREIAHIFNVPLINIGFDLAKNIKSNTLSYISSTMDGIHHFTEGEMVDVVLIY